MLEYKNNNHHDKKLILGDLIKIIEETVSGWEMQFEGSITPETLLGADLAFKSLDFVRLVTAIQQQYIQEYIPFQNLFLSDNGETLQDIQVSYLVDFLHKHLNKHELSK